jgi:hypothetical protein
LLEITGLGTVEFVEDFVESAVPVFVHFLGLSRSAASSSYTKKASSTQESLSTKSLTHILPPTHHDLQNK